MATQRYKISLLVLKKIRTSEIFFKHEKRNFASSRSHVMLYYYWCTNTNEIPRHFILIFFLTANGVISHVAT